MKLAKLSLAALAATAALQVQAVQPFEVTVSSTTLGGPAPVTVGTSNFLDLVEAVINAEDQFMAFDGYDYDVSFVFLGVPQAIEFTISPDGDSALLEIPSIGYSHTFTGTNRDEVEDSVEDWFEQDGTAVYGDFLKTLVDSSAIIITDGNPYAATALQARQTFESFAVTADSDLVYGAGLDKLADVGRFSGFGLEVSGDSFEAGDFSGESYEVNVPFRIGLSRRVGLEGAIPLNYTTVADAKVFGGGLNLALPVKLTTMTAENRLSWRVIPVGGVSLRGSEDLAAGVLLFSFGAANAIDYRVSDGWIVSLISQATQFESSKINYDDYEFNPGVSQLIIKNRLQIATKPSKNWTLKAYVADTRFMDDAAIDQFWTLGSSARWATSSRSGLVLNFAYDTGDDFSAYRGTFSFLSML